MAEYFVYILRCSDDTFYTGITNDLKRRILEHQEGMKKDSYTYSRRPFQLVFYERFNNPKNAIAMEKKLKGWSHAKKEALINSDFETIKRLSQCRNNSHFKN